MKILVVDDDEMTCRYLVELLADHDVISVTHDFRRLIGSDLYDGVDVALVDLRLGADLSGQAVLDYLAEHHPHIRRVAVTAARDNGPAIPVLAADTVLLKPFRMEELHAALR